MKVLLLNPPVRIPLDGNEEIFFIKAGSRWPFSITKRVEEFPPYRPFPFFLAYTAALLKKGNFPVKVIDGVTLNLTKEQMLRQCREFSADISLIETSTVTVDYDLAFAKELKEHSGIKVALSGPHVSVFPQEILRHNAHIDYLIRGEYENVFLELVNTLSRKLP